MPFIERPYGSWNGKLDSSTLEDPNFILPAWVNVTYDVSNQLRRKYSLDTKVVQWLLITIYEERFNAGEKIPDMGMDGYFGDETKEAIQFFQKDLRFQKLCQPVRPGAQGPVVPPHPDGFAHRAYGPPGQKIRFTIYRLNRVMAVVRLREFNLLMLNIGNLEKFWNSFYNAIPVTR